MSFENLKPVAVLVLATTFSTFLTGYFVPLFVPKEVPEHSRSGLPATSNGVYREHGVNVSPSVDLPSHSQGQPTPTVKESFYVDASLWTRACPILLENPRTINNLALGDFECRTLGIDAKARASIDLALADTLNGITAAGWQEVSIQNLEGTTEFLRPSLSDGERDSVKENLRSAIYEAIGAQKGSFLFSALELQAQAGTIPALQNFGEYILRVRFRLQGVNDLAGSTEVSETLEDADGKVILRTNTSGTYQKHQLPLQYQEIFQIE